VVIDGVQVGSMYWAMDGSNQIIVLGDFSAVDAVAAEVAAQLGAVYERTADVRT
jgi:hypothetical protein